MLVTFNPISCYFLLINNLILSLQILLHAVRYCKMERFLLSHQDEYLHQKQSWQKQHAASYFVTIQNFYSKYLVKIVVIVSFVKNCFLKENSLKNCVLNNFMFIIILLLHN